MVTSTLLPKIPSTTTEEEEGTLYFFNTFTLGCQTRDRLISGPSVSSDLVQAFANNHESWSPTTWSYFQKNYLDFIIKVIANDTYSNNVKHSLIFQMLKDFLNGELENNNWFTCTWINNWGTVAEYMNCRSLGNKRDF